MVIRARLVSRLVSHLVRNRFMIILIVTGDVPFVRFAKTLLVMKMQEYNANFVKAGFVLIVLVFQSHFIVNLFILNRAIM